MQRQWSDAVGDLSPRLVVLQRSLLDATSVSSQLTALANGKDFVSR
jgi:hypothetical protein